MCRARQKKAVFTFIAQSACFSVLTKDVATSMKAHLEADNLKKNLYMPEYMCGWDL